MTTKQKYKIIEDEFVDILDKLHIVEPNTGNILQFDSEGYFSITDPYGKRIKRYKTLERAMYYMLENI